MVDWRNRRKSIEFFEICESIFNERYKGLVKYWLTFNEINMILHAPFMGRLACILKKAKMKKTSQISSSIMN